MTTEQLIVGSCGGPATEAKHKTLGQSAFEASHDNSLRSTALWQRCATADDRERWQRIARAVAAEVRRTDKQLSERLG